MLKPNEYFERYGRHLSDGLTGFEAWDVTERDFFRLYEMRRYLTYASFMDAHSLYRSGHRIKRVVLHIMEEIKI